MKKTINKEVLKNWIKHTDSQNRVWEESEMWKQRKLETEAQDRGSDKRTAKRRKEDPPAQGKREYVSGYWNKKLMELKEKDSTRWGHSGYKELYPEEFGDKPTDKQHAKHAKKRHHESSDSEDVSRNDVRLKPARKETEDEKTKRHKKSKQKDEPPLVHKGRGKSPKISGKSPGFVKKSYKNKDLEKSSKNMEEMPYQRDKSPKNKGSSGTRIKSASSDSEPSDLDIKTDKKKKRRKASPEKEESPQLKSPNLKLGKAPSDEQGRSSRAAEIRQQIEKLEHSVDEKRSKRSSVKISDKSEENYGPALPAEMISPSADGLDSGSDVKLEKPKKQKKKKKYHHDADTDEEPLIIEEKVDKKAKHKDSSDKSKQRPKAEESEFSPVKKSKKHHKSEGSYVNVGVEEEFSKRKKSNKAKKSDKCHDSNDTKSRTQNIKSEDKISRKNGKHDSSVENEAEEMKSRETAKGSKKHKKSKQSSDSPKKSDNLTDDRKGEEMGDEEESDRSSKKKCGDSNNGYKRLKFKAGASPQRRRSPSPTISTSLYTSSSALDDIKDPMEDFPKSGTDNESISEGELSPSKDKKPQKKAKKSKKKKKDKKKKDKKSSKSKGGKEPKYSLEVSDNFGLCDSVLAFDEIGDIELE